MDKKLYNIQRYKSFTQKSGFPKSAYLDPERDEHVAGTGTFEFDQYYDLVLINNQYNYLVLGNKKYVKQAKKSLKRRNEKLDALGHIWFESRKELAFGNDPGRSECVDRGEIHDLHEEYKDTAVRRYFYRHGITKKSVLLRLSTALPVVWNNEKQEWMDIAVTDKKLEKKFKSLVKNGGGTGKYDNGGSNRNKDTDWNSEALCYLPRILHSDVKQEPPKLEVSKKYIVKQYKGVYEVSHVKPESNIDITNAFDTSNAQLDPKRGHIEGMTYEEEQHLQDLTKQGFRKYRKFSIWERRN
jgi:hypothetical protein